MGSGSRWLRHVFRSFARGALNLRGGGPFGEDFGVAAEFVFHGGGGGFEEV